MRIRGNGVHLAAVRAEHGSEPALRFSPRRVQRLSRLAIRARRGGVHDAESRDTASSRFLRDTQRDALVERADSERALAQARTTGHADALGIDDVIAPGLLLVVQDVDDAAHTPGPTDLSARARAGAVDVREQTAARLFVSKRVVVVVDCRHA